MFSDFTNQNGITGTFNQSTGTLTLSGSASVANYQAALASVTYSDSSQNPNTGARTVSFSVTDANSLTSTVSTAAVNVLSPVLTNDSAVTVNEGGTVAITTSALDYTDTGNNPATMTYTLTTTPTNGHFALASTPGTAITSFTQAQINAGSIVYVHNGSNTNSDSVTFSVSDTGYGTITGQTFNITVHDNPIVTATNTASFTEGGSAVAISPTLTLSDNSTGTLSGATVQITGNNHTAEDILHFTNQNGITGTFNQSTGTLTLSGSTPP